MGIELAETPYDNSGLLRPPADAVGLSAIRALPDGSMRQYSAVGFHSGWGGVEHFIRTLRSVGYIRPSSSTTSYAVLDVLDANDAVRGGQTVQYSVIPVYGSSGNVAPIGLRIEAYGNKGFALRRYLENPAGMFHIEG
jgi:hypothetical protein